MALVRDSHGNYARTTKENQSSNYSGSGSTIKSSSSTKSSGGNTYAGTVKIGGGGGVSVSTPTKSSTLSTSTPSSSSSGTKIIDGGRSAVTSDGVTITKKDGGYVVNNGGGSSGTVYSGSDTNYNPSGGSLASKTEVSTVQPVYISGGSGGTTYRVVNPDGTSYQIATTDTLAGTAQYFADKAASTSDPVKAAEWAKAAGDFAAAANYELTNSNIRATYGSGTGVTYDATTALTLDYATGKTYIDPSKVEQYTAGNGLLGSESSKAYYNAQSMSRTLGGSLGTALGSNIADSAGTSGAGDPSDVVLGNQLKSTVNLDEVMSRGSDLVNGFLSVPDMLSENLGFGGTVAGMAYDVVLPTSVVGTLKKVFDGRIEDVTATDWIGTVADILFFVPGFQWVKFAKIAKPVSAVVQTALGGLGLTMGAIDNLNTDDGGNPDDGDPDTPAPKQDTETPEVPYPVKKPEEQTTIIPTPQPEQVAEYDMSGITDMLAALFAQKTSGADGGSGVTLVTNEAQPVDYSGVFRYIIPAILIIGVIIVASKLLGNKKKGGSAA